MCNIFLLFKASSLLLCFGEWNDFTTWQMCGKKLDFDVFYFICIKEGCKLVLCTVFFIRFYHFKIVKMISKRSSVSFEYAHVKMKRKLVYVYKTSK